MSSSMTMPLKGHHLVLGVTGGIAAYKACELVRRLQDAGASVQVVMTEAATKFVTPMSFQALSGRPVYTDAWSPVVPNHMPHIELSREASAVLVAPATADFMARVATGQTPDLLTSLCLARENPLFLAPAMNRQMWSHPATQANAQTLRDQGVQLLGPASGEQACGEVGAGRMLEPHEIVAALVQALSPPASPDQPPPLRGRLLGRPVLITAGPTFEPIDPVRGITNRSSGKMGYALAEAAAEAGAEVTLVSGPVALKPPRGVRVVSVTTALEMQAAVEASLAQWPDPRQGAFLAVAAVADWRPEAMVQDKLKKAEGADLSQLRWVENPDILAGVGHRPAAQRPLVVGFAAETGSAEGLALSLPSKRGRKQADLLVGNLAIESLGADQAELLIDAESGQTLLPRDQKDRQARRLVHQIADAFQDREDQS